MTTPTKPRKYKDNGYMTSLCKHGPKDICDCCLIALGDHEGLTDRKPKGPVRSHRFKKQDGGEVFVCASCA